MRPSRGAGGAEAGSVALLVAYSQVASDCRHRASEASAVKRVRRGRRMAAPAVAVTASLSGRAAASARKAPAVVRSLGPSCAPGAVASAPRKGLATTRREIALR